MDRQGGTLSDWENRLVEQEPAYLALPATRRLKSSAFENKQNEYSRLRSNALAAT